MAEKITIGCCWDGRGYYPKEYVNILYRMVQRHTTIPFDFVLYIGPEAEKPGRCDGIEPAIRIFPVGLPAWWSGVKFWQPDPAGITTRGLLYLDLDIVIISNIDDIIAFPSEHAMSREFPAGSWGNSLYADNGNVGVTLIRNNAGSRVWEEYVKAGAPTWDPLVTHNRGALPLAVQTICNEPKYGIKKDLFPGNWVCSYKLQVEKSGIPADCKIIHFHGKPKPHDVLSYRPWVKENWR